MLRLSQRKSFYYKDRFLIKEFRSARDAGEYAVGNGICSYGWCGSSLDTEEETQAIFSFPKQLFLVYPILSLERLLPQNRIQSMYCQRGAVQEWYSFALENEYVIEIQINLR